VSYRQNGDDGGAILTDMSSTDEYVVLLIGSTHDTFKKVVDELEQRKVKVVSKPSSLSVAENIEQIKPDIILLDTTENELDSLDILKAIRVKKDIYETPVIVLVKDAGDKIQEMLSAGASDYITTTEEVEQVIDRAFSIISKDGGQVVVSDIDISSSDALVTISSTRVFVVEDDPLLRNLLSARFAKASFPFEFDGSGINAIPAIKQFNPDVIILDIMLPGISGLEILKKIKAETALRDIPVIIFSNRDSYEDKTQAQEFGAAGFYIKALTDLSELVEKIESLALDSRAVKKTKSV
jgi:DNA-binding response OmpR family regulator